MKTLVLLTPIVGATVTEDTVKDVQNYFGLKNVDLDVDKEIPACVYKGTLTETEKSEAEDFILKKHNAKIGVIFVEYEKDESDNDDCITLIRKDEYPVVNNNREI